MLTPIAVELKLAREIFFAPAGDGVRVTFGVLGDGRCGVSRAGEPVEVWDADPRGILAAMNHFTRLTASANGRACPARQPRSPLPPPPRER